MEFVFVILFVSLIVFGGLQPLQIYRKKIFFSQIVFKYFDSAFRNAFFSIIEIIKSCQSI